MIKEIMVALLGGLTASAIGAYVQYAITLRQVEMPKLALESRKAQLDAHRQILALSPNMNTQCSASRWNDWAWRIQCDTKSSGMYPAWVHLKSVMLMEAFDARRQSFKEGEGFDIYYPQGKKEFLATPGSDGYLEFFVTFRKQAYPKGIVVDGLAVQPTFVYSVVESAKNALALTFPEQSTLISEVATTPDRMLSIPLQGTIQAHAPEAPLK
ncbi:hypothetical protein ACS5PK_17045 [Roseateles sp. DB2]|uniref:hypothetical protein n=1 Tax=Roseateles sp. DB2 TaxID=3453717 RepID=UPI003EECDDCC